jgi:hypothetical protein
MAVVLDLVSLPARLVHRGGDGLAGVCASADREAVRAGLAIAGRP